MITKQDVKVGLATREEVGQAAPATPDRSCEGAGLGWEELLASLHLGQPMLRLHAGVREVLLD